MNDDEMSFKQHIDHESGPLDHSAHENDSLVGAGANVQGDGESRSDVTDGSSQLTSRTDCDTPESSITVLAWQKGGGQSITESAADLSQTVRPGEYVMRSLFADFTVLAEKKMDQVLAEPQEKPLSKVLQRGEDPVFDQLLTAFGCVAEHCLPSILRALFAWYERQMRPPEPVPGQDAAKKTPENRGKGLFSGEPVETKEAETILQERRDLAVEFVFCLILIEVLKQLPFHPGHEHLVTYIESVAFKHFKYKEGMQNDPNATNMHTVADLYAEVIGVLAQSRFQSVRKRFTSELKELRAKEPNTHTTQSIISLLMGMKFFRVKMVPIEEFEASFQFMQECATYFTELKDKDIKHALAGLFVEILVPVAATVKNEVNVPCVKNFVESLYGSCLDMCTKSKHRLALFPLVTCLLCVSQKTFFLANWHYFLALCLSHLKNSRDPKISRVALESLYRLLWVYMIRIKCESNSATQSRLQSIVNSLFPKGSKAVVPRDTPLNIFVKIIQFIAQERLDFAMREIVFDLLSVGRPIKLILTPERMSIGLRAFLVVADSLQQKEGEPPMPRTSGVLPSGNTMLRVKKTYLNKMLTEDTARSIGIHAYFPHVRRVFVDILRALDIHYGRPLMMTSTQNVNKEPDEMITGERKPRIDLFRTCVAAVPRLIPEAMTRSELVDLLARLTTHMDEELRGLAYQSLQTLVIDFPDWRHDVIAGFTQFLAREVLDTFPQLVDNGLRMLLQLLTSWRNALQVSATSLPGSLSRNKEAVNQKKAENANLSTLTRAQVFHQVEGFALVMLCNVRLTSRRLSVHILREIKLLNKATPGISEHPDQNVIDVIDKACPDVLEQCLPQLTCADKTAALTASCIDLQWIADRSASVWTAGIHEDSTRNPSGSLLNLSSGSPNTPAPDPWGFCLFQFLQKGRLLTHCPTAVSHAWPIVYLRLHTLFPVIDPTPVSDNRASLLRSSAAPRKPPASEAARDAHLALWRYLALVGARVVPPVPCPQAVRCASPDLSLTWGETALGGAAQPPAATDKPGGAQPPPSPTGLYKLLVPLLRCETTDVRDAAVHALGNINAEAVKDLMEEMVVYIREAVDRKTENMRRRRRRDALRLQLVRVFELIAEHGTFGAHSASGLLTPLAEYVDGARICLELEADKQILREIKAHFCNFVCKMIHSFPLESRQSLLKRDLRRNLFSLFTSWAGPYGRNLNITQVYSVSVPNPPSNPGPETLTTSEEELQLTSLGAMSAVLTCGPCFDPSTLLAEDGILYPWLDMLLASPEEKTYTIGCQTVILLLECNPDMGPLLDWVVDRCYTASAHVADGCFLALATIFSTREYPCDHYTAIINVALMNTGCPRTHIHETALQLLHLLDKRFFGSVDLLAPAADGLSFETGSGNERHADAALLSNTYCRSQMHLSEQMSQLHPELTMPMFSEITHRFQTARPEVRQILLQYLLPWLHNMELLDPNVPPANPLSYYQYCSNDVTRPGCRREGWGSVEATEMVLNNLFYITAKFADELPKEIEDVWATLCSCWPNNMKVIIRYLIIMSGMAPNQLLVYAKRVVLYIARARPDRLLDEMVVELQTVETLSWLIERTETPPFYRLTSMRKPSNHSDLASDPPPLGAPASAPGTIHTKRHSAESEAMRNIGTCKSDSAAIRNSKFVPPRGSDKIRTASGPAIMSEEMFTPPDMEMLLHPDEIHRGDGTGPGTQAHNLDILQPHPLPMPEYGGYFAPLTEYLPEGNQPSSGFHRCNVAIMLLTDLVVAPIELDWTAHLPLTLHILFLGLDHPRSTVLDHCKRLLLNLLLVLGAPTPWHQLTVAQILLNTNTRQLLLGLTTPPTQVTPTNFTDPDSEFELYQSTPADHPTSTPTSSKPEPPLIVVPEDEVATVQAPLSPDPKNRDIQHVMISLIDFLSSKHNQVLWAYEDITAKVWSVRSADQLDVFLRHVLRLFRESLPHALISERWAQTALQLGLSCGSRHYAGRSLQIFRALRVPINSRMLTDILSRLVETVAETGEDMQGYVTELLLTLEAAVDALESDFRPLDHMKELFKSTPNLNNKEAGGATSGKRSPGLILQGGMMGQCSHMTGVHTRSTSYSISYCTRKTNNCAANHDNKGTELRSRVGAAGEAMDSRPGAGSISPASGGTRHSPSLGRSRSAQSLKLLGEAGNADDKLTILAQAFWLAVSLLESDYEHEYLLGLRLLARVLSRLPLDRPDARDKVDKLQIQLKPSGSWPGVHSLLLKGCSNPNTYEAVVPLLSQFTPLLDFPVVDATQSVAFPMNVVALLPYMLLHYEDANELCIMSAENIAQLSAEKSKKLENLGTVMTLYSRRTFSKESFQWTKCVVKYLYDSYSHLSMTMLTFLVEVLEKGPPQMQLPVLNIIHCMLHYVDLNSSSHFNAELLRVIGKYIEGPNYKEALFILKLVVTRSSTLVTPPQLHHQYINWESHTASSSHSSFTEFKKELPGRTMEFTVDLSQTPVIGRKVVKPATSESEVPPASPRRSVSLSPGDGINITGWKRPWMSQSRVRDCLVNVLTTCGQRVGLPKSPSVIFSQSSDLLERQSSMASSTEEVSGPDLSGGTGNRPNAHREPADQFGVFKDFDFLEYESESVEGESTDNFNWGVRRRPLSEGEENPEPAPPPRTLQEESTPLLTARKLGAGVIEESSDDEIGSESPLDEIPPVPEFSNTSSASGHHHHHHHHHQPSTLNIRPRSTSDARSDTSGSSTGDISELTPCNTSPNLAFRPILREDTEEMFRLHIQSLLQQTPPSSLHLFHTLHRLIKDIVRKTVSLTRDATHHLGELGSLATPLTSHFSALSDCLSGLAAEVPLVYFNPEVINLPPEPLRFGLLQMKEHTDTLLDRNDQAAECVDALRAVFKLQTLGEESSGGGRSHEEPIVDAGRSLYKLYFQLMLLLESANKMIALVVDNARTNHLHDVSSEVILMRKSLVRAQDDIGIATPTPTPPPSLGERETEGVILDYLAQAKWVDALIFTRTHRNACLSEAMLPSTSEDDDVTNLISLYCQQVLREKPDAYIVTDRDLGHILSHLMEGLMQVLTAVSTIEANLSPAPSSKHSSHLSTRC